MPQTLRAKAKAKSKKAKKTSVGASMKLHGPELDATSTKQALPIREPVEEPMPMPGTPKIDFAYIKSYSRIPSLRKESTGQKG